MILLAEILLGVFFVPWKEMITISNPYTGLLNIMQQQGKKYNPPSVCLGEVISANPLSIKTEDLILESDDLLVSDILMQGYKRSVDLVSSGTLTSSTQASSGGGGEASFTSHNHKISGSYNCLHLKNP